MQDSLKLLKNDGFIILRNVIDKSLIDEILSYASELLNCDRSSNNIINAIETLEKKDKTKFYNFCKQMGQIPPVTKIALSESIFNLAKNITKLSNLYLTDQALFYNSKYVERLQYDWHQENVYFPNSSNILSLWYPWLHRVDENNGTMIMAKGAHQKNYKYEKIIVENGLTQMKIKNSDLDQYEKVSCNLDLCDAVFFLDKCPHRTGFNKSGIPRTSLITRFTDKIGKFDNGW